MDIAIIIFALAGLYIAIRIAKEKRQKMSGQKMVCFVGQDCEKVVFSEYSKFLGISLEKMGVLYYLAVAVTYLITTIFPNLTSDLIMFVLLGITFGGFIFSIYLTLVQIVKLKNYCSWCISSAVTSTIIFILSFIKNVVVENTILEYFESFPNIIAATETFSIAMICAITLITILRIARTESVMRIIWQVNLLSLFLFVLSNINNHLSLGMNDLLVIVLVIMNFINLNLTKHLIITSTKK